MRVCIGECYNGQAAGSTNVAATNLELANMGKGAHEFGMKRER